MPMERHFLGWDEPLPVKVRSFFAPHPSSDPIDLENDLIVVPTRHAGRRLRDELAGSPSGQASAALSVHTVPPSYFFQTNEHISERVANAAEVKALWAHVLLHSRLRTISSLLPASKRDIDFREAVQIGELVQDLRNQLAEGGYRIPDVPEAAGPILEETDTWRDLEELETLYLGTLKKKGLIDPCAAKLEAARRPRVPERAKRVVLAAVPDPPLLTIQALTRLSRDILITVLVYAPEDMADAFDKWGRPIAEHWNKSLIDIPRPEENILLSENPAFQAKRVLQELASEQRDLSSVGIGAPDRSVIPFLDTLLSQNGIKAHDPADRPIRTAPIYSLIESALHLMDKGDYQRLRSLLRHPDFLSCLARRSSVPIDRLLTQLDRFQNRHLPVTLQDVMQRLTDGDAPPQQFPALFKTLGFLSEQLSRFTTASFSTALRGFLQTVYEGREVKKDSSADAIFIEAAEKLHDTLEELADTSASLTRALTPSDTRALFLRRFSEQFYHHPRQDAHIDLEGWLELCWSTAPCLLITGMNEGVVPSTRHGDIFLPDSLRRRLGLRDDGSVTARDTYLLRAMIESRRRTGRVCLIAGKTGAEGEPLRPSRLLFRCTNEDLPSRAAVLFGDTHERREMFPNSISFPLQPALGDRMPDDALNTQRIHVTAFSDYLACPFRFYLKRILGMERLDDEKRGLDATDFGTMVHDALQAMAENAELRETGDLKLLQAFLSDRIDEWIDKRFGPEMPLSVTIAAEAARQRLAKAAEQHILQLDQGWRIVEAERRFEQSIGDIMVTGKVDRIDRNQNDGRLRILDYKTFDTAQTPEASHLARVNDTTPDYARIEGTTKCWINLQLPLYAILTQAGRSAEQYELAQFCLPKAISETCISVWTDFNAELLESARRCAEDIVERIRERNFWPPSDRVKYDDFESLFMGRKEEIFDASFSEQVSSS